jgi:hypothetical protein
MKVADSQLAAAAGTRNLRCACHGRGSVLPMDADPEATQGWQLPVPLAVARAGWRH